MDYLGWELERQRSALAALLLGGGDARSPESYAESGQRNPGAWEALRKAGQDHADVRAKTAETPVSAWEAVLDGEAVWAARQDDRKGGGTVEMPISAWETILGGETGGPSSSEKRARPWRSEGTGALPGSPRTSAGYAARRGTRWTETGLAAKTRGLPAEGGEGGAASSEAGGSQDRAAGSTAARYSGAFPRVRRDGGSTSDMMAEDRPAAAGTVLWGERGTAALRAEDSAKTLSRAVQRDARRYDGGFNIF